MNHSPSSSSKQKILVVNHDPQGLGSTKRMLERAGFLVEVSVDGGGALQRLENGETPELILLEIAEHEEAMKTIQLCRRLRPEQKIAVFAEISDVSAVVQAVRLGALDYIAKQQKHDATNAKITCSTSIGPREGGGFGVAVEMQVEDRSLPQALLETLVKEAHEKICPYSHATRGNVDVQFEVAGG